MKLCPKCGKRFSDDANFCPVDAARLTPLEDDGAAAAASGDSLAARFDLRERLGGERTGVVCRAVDKQTHAMVAVKVLDAEVTANASVVQRMERELKQLERLQHTGIAKVIASGKRGDQTWIATELVDGARPLAEVVRSHGPLPATMAAELVEHIGEALIEAAQVGVVHHDLSPKNVLLAGTDLKLINFSVPVTGTETTPGVAEYVSPEQVEGKPADQRSNIYSLGTLFYFAVTGRPPFSGNAAEVHAQHSAGAITPPSLLVPIPTELEVVIMRALERAPSKRYLTVRQFVDEVIRASRGGGENMKTTQPLGRAGKPRAELVQTLLGMPGDQLRAAAAKLKAQEAAAATPVGAAISAASAPAAAASASAASSAGASYGPPSMPEPIAAAPSAAAPSTLVDPPSATPPAASAAPSIAPAPSAAAIGQPSVVPASVAAAPTQATPALSGDRSPWAPPGAAPEPAAAPAPAAAAPAPAAAAPVPAAAAPAAAIGAAPAPAPSPAASSAKEAPATAASAASVGAPSVKGNPAGSGRRKRTEGGGKAKGKFRETMWFKKGELDAAAAEAAAVERARTGKDVDRDKADSLPMDERYKDDGTLSHNDQSRYSLKTGGTQMMPVLTESGAASGDVSEDELINEMKAGRGKYVLGILLIIAAVVVIVLMML
jgi:eukaryotic-like serine/threonine-protein kinase